MIYIIAQHSIAYAMPRWLHFNRAIVFAASDNADDGNADDDHDDDFEPTTTTSCRSRATCRLRSGISRAQEPTTGIYVWKRSVARRPPVGAELPVYVYLDICSLCYVYIYIYIYIYIYMYRALINLVLFATAVRFFVDYARNYVWDCFADYVRDYVRYFLCMRGGSL